MWQQATVTFTTCRLHFRHQRMSNKGVVKLTRLFVFSNKLQWVGALCGNTEIDVVNCIQNYSATNIQNSKLHQTTTVAEGNPSNHHSTSQIPQRAAMGLLRRRKESQDEAVAKSKRINISSSFQFTNAIKKRNPIFHPSSKKGRRTERSEGCCDFHWWRTWDTYA